MGGICLEQFKRFLDSNEGKEFIKKERERIIFEREILNKYLNKLHNMSVEDRNVLFEKIKTKYESDDYKDRWYNRGIEPPETLYHYILEYGKAYGVEVPDNDDIEFIYEEYIIDNLWKIMIIFGQGCAYIFTKI